MKAYRPCNVWWLVLTLALSPLLAGTSCRSEVTQSTLTTFFDVVATDVATDLTADQNK